MLPAQRREYGPSLRRHGAARCLLAVALAIASPVVTGNPAGPQPPPAEALEQPPASGPCRTGTTDGFLRGQLHGAFEQAFDWRGAEIECGGMRRPDDTGIRLYFARRSGADGPNFVFLLGITGPLAELTRGERVTNVTLIDETSARFFNSGERERCWTRLEAFEPIPGTSEYRAAGRVYCLGALPSLSDLSSVTLSDLVFAGRIALDSD